MEILVYKLMFTGELVKNVEYAVIQLKSKKLLEEVPIGVQIVKNKKGLLLQSKPFKFFTWH